MQFLPVRDLTTMFCKRNKVASVLVRAALTPCQHEGMLSAKNCGFMHLSRSYHTPLNNGVSPPVRPALVPHVADAVLPTPTKKYRGIAPTLLTIWREEGVRGWYRGLTPAVISVPIFWGIYFYTYERAKGISKDITGSEHHLAPAIAAGALTDVVTNPFWVVRTRMQTQALHSLEGPAKTPTGMLETFRQLYVQEGWRVFYRGLTASFLGLSHVAIQFPVYERLKKVARSRRREAKEKAIDLMAASATSKVVASLVTYPHEVLRARMQDERLSVDEAKKTLWGTLQSILRGEGSQALYRGFSVNLVRVVPSCVATFLTYELLRARLLAFSAHEEGVQQ